MEAREKRFCLTAAGVVLLAFLCAAAFSAYLGPGMLVSFGDIMAFCSALVR